MNKSSVTLYSKLSATPIPVITFSREEWPIIAGLSIKLSQGLLTRASLSNLIKRQGTIPKKETRLLSISVAAWTEGHIRGCGAKGAVNDGIQNELKNIYASFNGNREKMRAIGKIFFFASDQVIVAWTEFLHLSGGAVFKNNLTY